MASAQQISWKRLAAESIAIVSSILLAFSLEAWWVNRVERIEEQEILHALKTELEGNIQEIQLSLDFRLAAAQSALTLLHESTGETELSMAELDQLLGSLPWWERADLADGVLNGIIQGGHLQLIEDGALRTRIASISSRYEELRHSEDQHFQTVKQVLYPFLQTHVGLAQISNAQRSKPGVETFPQPLLPTGPDRDHSSVFDEPEFAGVITNLVWDHNDNITALNKLQSNLARLITELDQAAPN